jgi:hypothetical protein
MVKDVVLLRDIHFSDEDRVGGTSSPTRRCDESGGKRWERWNENEDRTAVGLLGYRPAVHL